MKTKTRHVNEVVELEPAVELSMLDRISSHGVSRRDFLKGTGALIVSFSLAGSMKFIETGEVLAQSPPNNKVDSFIAILSDGSVKGFTGKVDLGTGTSIGLRQMLAEEVDVAFERIEWFQGDTALCPSQGATVGSQSIRSAGATIRRAGAAARQFLVNLASQRLGVPADQLDVNDGVVFVKSDPSKSVSYAELIGGQRFNIDVPAANDPNLRLKTPDQFKVIGRSIKRHDIGERVLGSAFVQNVRLPGMVHGRSLKPPKSNARLQSGVDEATIQSFINDIPGLIRVVVMGDYVGVVCEREEQAIKAVARLSSPEVSSRIWTEPAPSLPVQETLYADMKTLPDLRGNPDSTVVGDIDAGFAAAVKTFEATYLWPFQMHGAMAPMCAVADVKADGTVTVWSGGQNTFGEGAHISAVLGIPAENIRVIWRDTTGVYGRSGSTDDVSLEAAILSHAVGRPVRVQWLRADEHGYEPKGPPHVMTIKAGVDAAGNVTAWDYEDRFFPLVTSREPHARRLVTATPTPEGPGSNDGSNGDGREYAFPNKRITRVRLVWPNNWATMLRTNHLRAPGDPARHFATECFIDELAADARVDPLEFRLRQTTDERMIGVLQAAANLYGWDARPSPRTDVSRTGVVTGRGIAFGIRGTYITAIAEVEVDQATGVITVKRIVMSHDSGMVVNPDSIKQQIEGQVIQTAGRALMEEVKFDQFRVTSVDWIDYPIIKFPQVPQVESVLIDERNQRNPLPPVGGVGEPALNPVPAAIGNAVFDATGARLRQVPFTPERVLAALAARA